MTTNRLHDTSFEDSIEWFSLRFKENTIEDIYCNARINFLLVAKTIIRFLWISLALQLIMISLDIVASFSSPDSSFATLDIIIYCCYGVTIICEIACYYIPQTSNFRGCFGTIIICFIVTYYSFAGKADKIFYPTFTTSYFFS